MATDFLDGSHIVGGKNNGRSFFCSSVFLFFRSSTLMGSNPLNGSSKISISGSCRTVVMNCTFGPFLWIILLLSDPTRPRFRISRTRLSIVESRHDGSLLSDEPDKRPVHRLSSFIEASFFRQITDAVHVGRFQFMVFKIKFTRIRSCNLVYNSDQRSLSGSVGA